MSEGAGWSICCWANADRRVGLPASKIVTVRGRVGGKRVNSCTDYGVKDRQNIVEATPE
jgi:hypothetical protein